MEEPSCCLALLWLDELCSSANRRSEANWNSRQTGRQAENTSYWGTTVPKNNIVFINVCQLYFRQLKYIFTYLIGLNLIKILQHYWLTYTNSLHLKLKHWGILKMKEKYFLILSTLIFTFRQIEGKPAFVNEPKMTFHFRVWLGQVVPSRFFGEGGYVRTRRKKKRGFKNQCK